MPLSICIMLYVSNCLCMQTNITHGVVILNSCVPLCKSVGLQLLCLPITWSCLKYPSAPHMAMHVFAQPVLLKPLQFIAYEFWKYLFILTMYNNIVYSCGLFLNPTAFYLSYFKSRRLPQVLRVKGGEIQQH